LLGFSLVSKNSFRVRLRELMFFVRCCFNIHVAFVLYIVRGRLANNTWVIGGIRGEVYSDNSKVFYEYLLEQLAWVATKNSPAYRSAPGRVLKKGSVENYLYFYRSRVAIFSDTFNNDIAPYAFILPLSNWFYRRMLKTRLNHGTISFKRRVKKSGLSKIIRDRVMCSYDLSVASTELEKEVLNTYARKGTVELLGSARNDQITDAAPNNTILVAPTWRTWLVGNRRFEDSEFFDNYKRLLTSKRLLELLRTNDLKLQIYLHHMLFEYTEKFQQLTSELVSVFDPIDPIVNEIIGARLLITDYSSICAERYFLRKPIVFFQFDRDRYLDEIGSYIDLNRERVGSTVDTVDELVDCIEVHIENDFSVTGEQIHGEKYFVHFRDRRNCGRIFNAIISRLNVF